MGCVLCGEIRAGNDSIEIPKMLMNVAERIEWLCFLRETKKTREIFQVSRKSPIFKICIQVVVLFTRNVANFENTRFSSRKVSRILFWFTRNFFFSLIEKWTFLVLDLLYYNLSGSVHHFQSRSVTSSKDKPNHFNFQIGCFPFISQDLHHWIFAVFQYENNNAAHSSQKNVTAVRTSTSLCL